MNGKFKYSYFVLILFILIQLTPFYYIGVIASSIFAFYKILFYKKIDFVTLFLLFIPSIVLRDNTVLSSNNSFISFQSGWVQLFFPTLKSSFSLGSLSISPSFFAAIAVPFRLIKEFRSINRYLLILWLFALVLSITGLFISIINGISSAGGLTVGLRIVLTLGVLILPKVINFNDLKNQIKLIAKVSLIFFFLGILNNHWIFIAVIFPVILFFSNENYFWKSFSLVMLILFFLLELTFTIKLTLYLIFTLVILFIFKRGALNINKFKSSIILSLPLLLVFFVIGQQLLPILNLIGSEKFTNKLLDDRGGIWIYTLSLITESNFFLVPSGRDIPTFNFLGNDGYIDWGAGAHNIYLEMARQLGVFSSIILFIIIGFFFMDVPKFFRTTKDIFLKITSLGFISVYIIYGFTGNSLIFDGVGFLFWFMFSQIIISQNNIA